MKVLVERSTWRHLPWDGPAMLVEFDSSEDALQYSSQEPRETAVVETHVYVKLED